MRKAALLPLAGLALAAALLAAPDASAPAPAPKTAKQPAVAILLNRCGTEKCHGGAKPKEKLDLSSLAAIKATAIGVAAEQGTMKVVVPGDPEASYLFLKITKMRRAGDARIKWRRMPPGEDRLEDADIALIEAWIKAGAPVE
jgi:hypothetical protein